MVVGNPPPILEDTVSTTQAFWDPMLGVKAQIVLSRTVLLGLYGSVGGFGVGDASDFAWDFMYLNSFRISHTIAINAGFRSFGYDRTEGSGDDELKTVVKVLGPLIGATFGF